MIAAKSGHLETLLHIVTEVYNHLQMPQYLARFNNSNNYNNAWRVADKNKTAKSTWLMAQTPHQF